MPTDLIAAARAWDQLRRSHERPLPALVGLGVDETAGGYVADQRALRVTLQLQNQPLPDILVAVEIHDSAHHDLCAALWLEGLGTGLLTRGAPPPGSPPIDLDQLTVTAARLNDRADHGEDLSQITAKAGLTLNAVVDLAAHRATRALGDLRGERKPRYPKQVAIASAASCHMEGVICGTLLAIRRAGPGRT